MPPPHRMGAPQAARASAPHFTPMVTQGPHPKPEGLSNEMNIDEEQLAAESYGKAIRAKSKVLSPVVSTRIGPFLLQSIRTEYEYSHLGMWRRQKPGQLKP